MSDFLKQVEQYLKHDRTLVGGKNLYNKLPQKNKALQNAFSRFPNTQKNIDKVCYELAKAVGMPERILKMHTQNAVVATPEVVEEVEVIDLLTAEDKLLLVNPEADLVDLVKAAIALPEYSLLNQLNPAPIPNFSSGLPGNAERKALLRKLGVEKPKGKKADLDAEIQRFYIKAIEDANVLAVGNLLKAREQLVTTKINELPQEVKASIKLRDQFPFLSEPNCPDVLKIVVNDLITTYETFKENQPKLHELLGPAESKAIADTVTGNYIANKMAYNELEHYNTNKQILGAHPLFKRLELKEEISALDTDKLTKKINALTVNVSRNKDKPELLERDEDLLAHAKEVLSKR
ncbi:hypothetical protein [Thalassobellus citreus]|uniref:hypothetical protein n=1 Tax=Thalassobellus citreus TaxID=3367752 RepID=UPI0037B52B4B